MTFYLDLALLLLISGFLLATSITMIVRIAGGGQPSDGHNQVSVLPGGLRRWMLGESERKPD